MNYLDQLTDKFGLLICIYDSVVFAFAVYFVFSSKRIDLEDKILGWFWVSIFLHFFLVAISLLIRPSSFVSASIIYFIAYSMLFFQIILGAFYLVSKITKNFWLKVLSGIVLIALLFYLIIFSLNNTMVAKDATGMFSLGEIVRVPLGYGPAIFIGIMTVLCLLLILSDFKKGLISWGKMGKFYVFYAFIIYTSISLIRVLRFLPSPWYLELFYIFVPYLMYRSKKESK